MFHSLTVFRGIAMAALVLVFLPTAADACGKFDLLLEKEGPIVVKENKNGTIDYFIKVRELIPNNPDSGPLNIEIVDIIPSGLEYLPQFTQIHVPAGKRFATPTDVHNGQVFYGPGKSHPEYQPECRQLGNSVRCRLPYLSNDENSGPFHVASAQITLRFRTKHPKCGDVIKNTVTATAEGAKKAWFDVNPRNNVATVATKVTCPQPTVTPTPTPTPDKDPQLDVTKTDHRDVTRPGHSLAYEIIVENTGDQDLHDVRLTDTVPSQLTVTSISSGGSRDGQVITWTGISLEPGQKKTVTFSATVKQNTANNTVLHNRVEARSEDHDLHDEATDDTKVVIQRVAGVSVVQPTPAAVPVTATTGATSLLSLLATVLGGGALAATIRKI